jgi:triacylglycerol lipase
MASKDVQDLKDRILAPRTGATPPTSDPFGLAYINLCLISYRAPSDIPNLVAKMAPLNPGGYWQCTWGPALDPDMGNLVFVAVYNYGPNLPPVMAATVIRGTDLSLSNFWGSLKEIWEDMDILFQSNPTAWPANNNVLVANGTLEALTNIQNMTSPVAGNPNQISLQQYLTHFLGNPANENPFLLVTGHSLGGCLTTVVAPWLQYVLPQAIIVPATFAAPTAGNAAFAQSFQSSFSYQLRYHNTLDIAPTAWSDLNSWTYIYDPACNTPISDPDWAIVQGWIYLMMSWPFEVSYAQPFPNVALKGACQYPPTYDWVDEAYYQHHATNYWILLGGGVLAPELLQTPHVLPRKRIRRSRAYAKLGPPKAIGEKRR